MKEKYTKNRLERSVDYLKRLKNAFRQGPDEDPESFLVRKTCLPAGRSIRKTRGFLYEKGL